MSFWLAHNWPRAEAEGPAAASLVRGVSRDTLKNPGPKPAPVTLKALPAAAAGERPPSCELTLTFGEPILVAGLRVVSQARNVELYCNGPRI